VLPEKLVSTPSVDVLDAGDVVKYGLARRE
jgi:hypothetical protein